MMVIYDDHKSWSYMTIIYDGHLWWLYMMIVCDDHIWWSYIEMSHVQTKQRGFEKFELSSSGLEIKSQVPNIKVRAQVESVHECWLWGFLGGICSYMLIIHMMTIYVNIMFGDIHKSDMIVTCRAYVMVTLDGHIWSLYMMIVWVLFSAYVRYIWLPIISKISKRFQTVPKGSKRFQKFPQTFPKILKNTKIS